jgi:hypothetical protein
MFCFLQVGDPAFAPLKELSDGHNIYYSSCESFDSADFIVDSVQSPPPVDGQVGIFLYCSLF